jgi:hypothetical protein
VTALLVPPGVVAVTLLAVVDAPPVNVNVAVTVVAGVAPGVTAETVTPFPETVTAVIPVKPVPVRVTLATVLPDIFLATELGVIELSTGAVLDAAINVNVTALLVPFGVVAVTLLAVVDAPLVNVSVAVTVVSGVAPGVTPVTVTPFPETLTAVIPVKPVPVRVTLATAPVVV